MNDLSSRTFNDPNQYPIFPWLFFDLNKVEEILALDKNNIDQSDTISVTSERSRRSTQTVNSTTSAISIKSNSNLLPPERDSVDDFDLVEQAELKNKEKSNEELSKKYKIRNFSYPVSLQSEGNREKYINIIQLQDISFFIY